MSGQIRALLILLPGCLLPTLNCSPSPMLQSPRVKSDFSIGATGMYEEYREKLDLEVPASSGTISGGTLTDTIRRDREYHDRYTIFNPWYLKWGFARRVEISGLALPFFLSGFMINGHLKIFLNEHGTPLLFRNVSYALFGGGNAHLFDHYDDKTAYVGAILATRHQTKCREIELIVQPSYFQQRFNNGQRWLEGGGFKEYGYIDGLQVNFGTIYTAVNTGRFALELLFGGVYRYEMTNEWRYTSFNDAQVYRIHNMKTYSPLVVQGGVIFNFRSD